MANHSVVVRAFLKRGALFSIFLLMLLVAVGVAFQGGANSTIQPGGTASFPRTGYDYPTNAMVWDIKNGSGTIIAQDDMPNGWNLDVVNDNLVVTAPSTAVVGTNYEVRFSGVMQEIGAARTRAARASKSKADRLKPRAWGGSPARPGEKNTSMPIRNTNAHPDDIIIIPVSKSAYFDVISANVAPAAPSSLTATAVASNRVNLSWQDNSTNESGFKIYRLAPGGSWTLVTTTTSNITSYSDIPLLPSTTYSYKVTAVNSYGESAASNTSTQTTFFSTVLPEGYAGNDFYVIVPDNCSIAHTNHSGAKLRITAQDGATGLLTLTSTGEGTSFTVPAGGSTLVSLSDFHRLTQNDEVNNESYRLTTDNAVTVEVLDYDQYVSESWAVLPNAVLGTEYVTSNYVGSGGYMSQFAIVAITDNTVVTIKPPVICGSNRTPNASFTVSLSHGQAYQLKSTQWDLTGTQINSTQPIGVVSGAQGARVPLEYGYGNPLEEQLLPFNLWQTEYVGIPFAHHPHARFRLTAARNRTHISVYFGDSDTTSTYILNAGQMQEIETTSPILVNADKPFQGMQLSNGESYDYNFNDPTTVGDPMMLAMPSTFSPNRSRSNWLTNAIIPVATDGFDYHYVTLISETHAMTTMYLNGNVINGWQGIGNTRFEYVRVALSPGNNVINGVYQGGAVGVTYPARFVACTSQFAESDAAGSIVGGLTPPNDYVNVHPDDPVNLTAIPVSASAIDLAWAGDMKAYGYRVERKTETAQWVQIADVTDGSITTFHDTALHHKTKYYYRVIAYADEDSGYSNVASAQTLNEKPNVPTNLQATSLSDSQIRLNWTDTSDNEEHFNIQRSPNGQSDWADVQTTNPNVTEWTDSNLPKKTRYFYRVKASNEMGDLGWSNIASDTTKDTPPLAPDLTVVSGATYNSMNLTWVDHSDNEDGFYVQRLDAAGQWQTMATKLPNQMAHLDNSGLKPLTEYTYRVVAFNNGGETPSNTRSGITLAPPVPEAPTNLVAITRSDSQIDLRWDDNSSLETSYRLFRRVQGSLQWTTISLVANSTSYNDSGLNDEATYEYYVVASNGTGDSSPSNVATATTEKVLAQSTPIYLQDIIIPNDCLTNGGATEVILKMSRTSQVASVVTLWCPQGGIQFPSSVTIPAGQRLVRFTASLEGGTHYGDLYAKCGDITQKAGFACLSASQELGPGPVHAAAAGTGIIVSWSPPLPYTMGQRFLGFVVERSTDSLPFVRLNGLPNHGYMFCDTSASPGHSYQYRIEVQDFQNKIVQPTLSNYVDFNSVQNSIAWTNNGITSDQRTYLYNYTSPALADTIDIFVDNFLVSRQAQDAAMTLGVTIDTFKYDFGSHTLNIATEGNQPNLSSTKTFTTSDQGLGIYVNPPYGFAYNSKYPNFACRLPDDTEFAVIRIESVTGSLVKTWTMHTNGVKSYIKFVKDASIGFIDGVKYVVKVVAHASTGALHTYEHEMGVYEAIWSRPDFLGMLEKQPRLDVEVVGGKLPTQLLQEHADRIENWIRANSGARVRMILCDNGDVLDQDLKAELKYWLENNVSSLYLLAHGSARPYSVVDTGDQQVLFGDIVITNSNFEYGTSIMENYGKFPIYQMSRINGNYKFAYLYVCNSAGCDVQEPGYMQARGILPMMRFSKWRTAFNLNINPDNPSKDGMLVAFNGLVSTPFWSHPNSRGTQYTDGGRLAEQFFHYWIEMGFPSNSVVDTSAITMALIDAEFTYNDDKTFSYAGRVYDHFPGDPNNPKTWFGSSALEGHYFRTWYP